MILKKTLLFFEKNILRILVIILSALSLYFFKYYLNNGLGLAYNDARSHLDIGRRVVEGLKPGLAQLGSVWLPLNHLLMIPLIWNDWAWHTGFAGAIWNMLSFVGTGIIIYKYLDFLKIGLLGKIVGVFIFVANLNILYLQSTAMTEPLLLFTMTIGCYYLLIWHTNDTILDLIKAAFWIMLSTLVRYDGWFLLGFSGLLVIRKVYFAHKNYSSWADKWNRIEGTTILFSTLAVAGVIGWLLWNKLIFGDALYFMLGPFSAHAQQLVMEASGALPTKWDILLSLKVYFYSLLYSSYTYPAVISAIGMFILWFNKSHTSDLRWGTTALIAPLFFNIIALYLGFSVIYVQGISGDTWFNIRYGAMLAPTIAIFCGYLIDYAKNFRLMLITTIAFTLFFSFTNMDSVSIDDARVGSSQKNVSEVSGFLSTRAKSEKGFVLISAASHDAIIFSSGLPMKRFIHEGTGKYWDNALTYPDRWARWIVMRTYDNSDLVWKGVNTSEGFVKYQKVESYPFADVYELKEEFLKDLVTDPVIKNNK